MARARDRLAPRVRERRGEVVGDRLEVGVVVLPVRTSAGTSSSGSRGVRSSVRSGFVGLVVDVELERPSLLHPHRLPHRLRGRREPEVDVHLGRAIEVARLERLVLRRAERLDLRRPVVVGQSRAGEHETHDAIRM